MNTEQLHSTLERLCNLLRVEARAHGAVDGLLPVQLEALHYLSQCNRYSDTVQGVTEFLGQTKGTVSQTLKVLESRALVRKVPDARDRRLVHLALTPAGRRMVAKVVPARFLEQAVQALPEPGRDALGQGLEALLRAAQRANQGRSFGACKTCRYNERAAGTFRCGLTAEPLSATEVERLCREHRYPAQAAGG